MKRIIGLLIAFCLVLTFVDVSVAEANWEFVQQPIVKTTKSNITISVRVKGKNVKYQWVFVNPENPEDIITGKNLGRDERFSGIKVSGYDKNKIVLSNLPEELHGWNVYCHTYSNGNILDSDIVEILLYGMDPPEHSVLKSEPASEVPTQKMSAIEPEYYDDFAAIYVLTLKMMAKNPDSLKVHSINIMRYKGYQYLVVDFSSKNDVGRYVREAYSFRFEEASILSSEEDFAALDLYNMHKSDFSLVKRLDVDTVMRIVNK